MLAGLLARGSLKRLSQRIDPRRNNGGVFLGLNGTVIKSHGSADATGIASALTLAHRLAKSGFSDKLAARVATAGIHAQDTAQSSRPSDDGPTKDEPSK
jgi:glycerol-3-phosphate acyltransferase PlsX